MADQQYEQEFLTPQQTTEWLYNPRTSKLIGYTQKLHSPCQK